MLPLTTCDASNATTMIQTFLRILNQIHVFSFQGLLCDLHNYVGCKWYWMNLIWSYNSLTIRGHMKEESIPFYDTRTIRIPWDFLYVVNDTFLLRNKLKAFVLQLVWGQRIKLLDYCYYLEFPFRYWMLYGVY